MDTKDLKFFTVILAIIVSILFTVVFCNKTNENVSNLRNEMKAYQVEQESHIIEIPVDTTPETIEVEEENWWTDYDLELLARTIYWEAGSNEILDEHQQLVAAVVLNRVNDSRCPDTIYDVIMDDRYGIQYSTRYKITLDKTEIPQRCYDNALVVLNGEIDCPSDLIYQSNFKQGFEIWKTFKTSYSTTYFCRG